MPCGYCRATIYVKVAKVMKSVLAPLTHVGELREELENLTGEMYVPLPNRYCPMCGEKITKGETYDQIDAQRRTGSDRK